MKRYFIYFLLALAFALPTRVVSRPDGAPTCIDNRSAPGEPHRSNGFDESSIDAGGLEVSIGGELVYPDTPIQVETGVSYMVVISTTTFFRGVMTRLGGGDNQVDTSTVFTLVEGEVDLKLNENCDLDVSFHFHPTRKEKSQGAVSCDVVSFLQYTKLVQYLACRPTHRWEASHTRTVLIR